MVYGKLKACNLRVFLTVVVSALLGIVLFVGAEVCLSGNGEALAINSGKKLFDASMIDDGFGFAVGGEFVVGGEGVIVEYINGRWYYIAHPTTPTLMGISLINETYGFAVGFNGTILFFDGMSWQHHNKRSL